jgi:hypothetical protein
MSSYSAAQIVGKQLTAKRPIELKRNPADDSKTVYTAPIGANIGVVYSWTGGTEGQPLWWMFYDKNQKTYYAKHESGAFELDSLKDQGALNVQEERAEQKKKEEEQSGGFNIPNPFGDLSKPLNIGITVIAVALGISLLRK